MINLSPFASRYYFQKNDSIERLGISSVNDSIGEIAFLRFAFPLGIYTAAMGCETLSPPLRKYFP